MNPPSRSSSRRTWLRSANGTTWAFVLLAVSLAQALAPLARSVDYTYPALNVIVTVLLLRRSRVDHALELNLWSWATAPGLRRVVDWSSGTFNESSLILATPSLTALVVALTALQPQRRWPLGAGFGVFAYAVAGGYAWVIGTANHGILPALISVLLWFAPLGLGLVLLTADEDRPRLVEALLRFARWALLVLSGYAVLQWAVSPAWDVFWLANVWPSAELLGSPFGTPEPFGLRPSSTMNGPFVLAHTLVWLLVSQVGQAKGRPMTYAGVALGCLALGLTGIRAAWLTAALVVLVLGATRKIRLTPLAITGGLIAFLVITFMPTVAQTIGERVGTVETIETDVSLLARLGTYAAAVPAFLGDPIGRGLGATGSGARANPQDSQVFILDSSYLEILRVGGSVIGALAILALLALCVVAYARSWGLSQPGPAWGALALVAPVDMLLGSITIGPAAVVTWAVIGACASASPSGARSRAPAGRRLVAARPVGIRTTGQVLRSETRGREGRPPSDAGPDHG